MTICNHCGKPRKLDEMCPWNVTMCRRCDNMRQARRYAMNAELREAKRLYQREYWRRTKAHGGADKVEG